MTWRKVAVGVLCADTYEGVRESSRMDLVVEAVYGLREFRDEQAKAYNAADGAWDRIHDRPSMVFVAPEYMFSKAGKALTGDRLRSGAEKDAIEKELKAFSSGLGTGAILAPGSISYVEPLGAWDQASKAVIEPRLKMGANATKLALEGAATKTEADAASVKKLPAGYYGRPGAGRYYTAAELLAQATRLQGVAAGYRALKPQQKSIVPHTPSTKEKQESLDRGDVKFVARNEMVLYHKGRDVARYAKIADFCEVPQSRQAAGANCTVFVPGLKPGRATVGGVPWGVEICFDHNLGVLSAAKTDVLPLVHLLCSAAVNREEKHSVVKPGGYVIHSSSEEQQCGIWRKDLQNNSYDKVQPVSTLSVLGGVGKLFQYVIDLNLP
jgi:hypothetical protein